VGHEETYIGRREIHEIFYSEDLKERDHWEDIRVNGKEIVNGSGIIRL
jgi:hypothetical protein